MNYKKLFELVDITTGKKDSNQASVNGIYPFFTCAPKPLTINSYSFDCDAIMIAGNNAQGNFHLNRYNGKFDAYQRTYVLTAKDKYPLDYIFYCVTENLQQLKSRSQGSQTKFLTIGLLKNMLIPALSAAKQLRITNIVRNSL